MIHASQKICPHCGTLNKKEERYDDEVVALELLNSKAPFTCDVLKIIGEFSEKRKADGEPYKPLVVVHEIKRQLVFHVQRIWRVKRLDDKLYRRMLQMFHEKVDEWSRLTSGKKASGWLLTASREWLEAELIRVWKYQKEKEVV